MSNTQNTMSKNRSKTGDGHTMSKIDVHNELAAQERDLINSHKGLESACGKCGESFRLSQMEYNVNDAIILDEFLLAGGCPACNNWKTAAWHRTRNDLLQMSFTINDKEIKTLRWPSCYKPRAVLKVNDKGQIIL